MAAVTTEQDLLSKTRAYLKSHYGEDTLRMDVLGNNVQEGEGTLLVECTVSVGGLRSNWRKTFTFRDGEASTMTWRHLG